MHTETLTASRSPHQLKRVVVFYRHNNSRVCSAFETTAYGTADSIRAYYGLPPKGNANVRTNTPDGRLVTVLDVTVSAA